MGCWEMTGGLNKQSTARCLQNKILDDLFGY